MKWRNINMKFSKNECAHSMKCALLHFSSKIRFFFSWVFIVSVSNWPFHCSWFHSIERKLLVTKCVLCNVLLSLLKFSEFYFHFEMAKYGSIVFVMFGHQSSLLCSSCHTF